MTEVQPVTYQPQPAIQPATQPGMYQNQSMMMAQNGNRMGMMNMMAGQQQQPEIQWMSRPEQIPGCPPGLEYLTTIDQVVVKQQVDLLEVFTGLEQQNKYHIMNSMGQQIFFAQEESEPFQRQCCGPRRGFELHITDNAQQEVIKVVREFHCCRGCPWCANSDCCAFVIDVEAPVGNRIAYIRQEQTFCGPQFSIRTDDDQIMFRIQGPVCIFPQCGGQEFVVTSEANGEEVGKITKEFAGLAIEMFTNADTFSISFPLDLDVKLKAAMIGAVFLIDFMFFQQPKKGRGRHHRHRHY